jgi:hypothetical protein
MQNNASRKLQYHGAVLAVAMAILTCCGIVTYEDRAPSRAANRQTANRKSKAQQAAGTCFQIVNGEVTNLHPAVVLLSHQEIQTVNGQRVLSHSTCSGTFIGTNAILTAGHCLRNGTTSGLRFIATRRVASIDDYARQYQSAEAATSVIHNPVYGDALDINNDAEARLDMAVLLFDKDVAPAVIPLAGRRPSEGARAIVVGYGSDHIGDPEPRNFQAISKRTGENSVLAAFPGKDWALALVGRTATSSPVTNPTDSLPAKGDSGGPMLVDGKVAGVVSAGRIVDMTRSIASYMDVTAPEALALFKRARAAGGKIGIPASGQGVQPSQPNSAAPSSQCRTSS